MYFYGLGVLFVILVILIVVNRKVTNIVRTTSKKYAYAEEVFSKLELKTVSKSYTFTKKLNSKSQLDNLNLDRQIISVLTQNPSIVEIVLAGLNNKKCLLTFNEQMSLAPPSPNEDETSKFRIRLSKYISIEDSLISSLKWRIKGAIPQYTFVFTYTSPTGKNSYQRKETLDIDKLSSIIDTINKESEYRNSAQYQRRLMSSGLRYDIMKRDGFRCTICGRGAEDGVKLHVDHIKPIAKGGKTEWNNLRTLCQDCNLGKKDKYSQNSDN